jgi:hypothetical protein
MGAFELVKLHWLFHSQEEPTRLDLDDGLTRNVPSCPPQEYDYKERHYPRNGSAVYGYPSTGGVLIASARALEMFHLGVDRFKDTKRSTDSDEEDEFCKRLRRIGAQLWESKAEYLDAMLGEASETALIRYKTSIETGWPSSGPGVWVLVYKREERYDRGQYEFRRGARLLRHCLTMDERCMVIKDLGGTFYSDPDDCEELRLLPEAPQCNPPR